MSKLKELRAKRREAAARMTDLADRIGKERRDFSADERASWDAANADYDRLGREVKTEEARAEQDRRAGDRDVGLDDFDGRRGGRGARRENVQHTEEQRSLAFRAWCRKQYGRPLTAAQRSACKALRFDPRSPELRIGLIDDRRIKNIQADLFGATPDRRSAVIAREMRANLSAQLGPSGGYLTAPGSLSSAFELNLLAFGGVRAIADIMTTESGEPFFWPTVDDTANTGALLGEGGSIGSGVNPTLGRKMWSAYKWTSTPVLIPSELLDDDQYDIAGQVGGMLGTRIARGQAPYLATGTGGSQPEGIITGAALGVTAASASAIVFDELVRLEHSVDLAYRSAPGVGWLMHDLVRSYIRRIKDGNGRPMWVSGEFYQSGMADGAQEKLLNYPVNICQEMDSTVATTKKTVLFGELPKYKIRRVRDVRMYRLVERYRDQDLDGFVAFERLDGKLLQAGTNPVKYLQQA